MIAKPAREQADAQGWSLSAVALPYLGVFVYLIARGHSMPNRQKQLQRQRQLEEATDSYIRGVASSPSTRPRSSPGWRSCARAGPDRGDVSPRL